MKRKSEIPKRKDMEATSRRVLREIGKKHRVSTTGTKGDLIDRLENLKRTSTKRAAKKAPQKEASKKNGETTSNRLAVFACLAKRPHGASRSLVLREIGMSGSNGQLGVVLRGETKAGRIDMERRPHPENDNKDIIYYTLTRKGKEHYKKGKIDVWAREQHLVELGRTPE